MCSWAIRTARAKEVEEAVRVHREKGGDVYLLSLTVRHGLGDDLRPSRAGVSTAWRRVQAGASWKRFATRFCLSASIRALEVTAGPNGFHPHIHALLFVSRALSVVDLADARDILSARWQSAVSRTLSPSAVPNNARGCDLRLCRRADYLTKFGLSLELLAPVGKSGRGASRSMLQVALDFTKHGDEADGKLWRAYCDGMRGARMLTWSRGLRAASGLVEVKSDEELLAEVEQSEETVLVISAGDWRRVRAVRGAVAAILEAAESAGAREAEAVLARLLQRTWSRAPERGG